LITFARFLGYLSYVGLAAFVIALVASGLRRWHLAARISRTVTLVGASIFALAVGVLILMLVSPRMVLAVLPFGVGSTGIDPSQKARVLGETISEMMNCGAFASLVALPSAILWAIALWRLRRRDGVAGYRSETRA
jgi:hypothetical protein